MSNNEEQRDGPPEFGADDDNSKTDGSMFESALAAATVDVSLSGAEEEEDDEGIFGSPQPSRQKTPTNTTNTVETTVATEKNVLQQDKTPASFGDDDEDIFNPNKTTPVSAPSSPAPAPVQAPPTPQPSSPLKQETPLFSPVNRQVSSSTPVAKNDTIETVTTAKPVQKLSNDNNINITVSDPAKVGDGMGSYMTYRITTKTTLPVFKKSEATVNRRFSDFLGLHAKVVNKHLHGGLFLPSPPEKEAIPTIKGKISKDDGTNDFIDRRRALLERYLNRLVQHEKLIEDPDVQEFLQSPNDLPKATSTQALSGAGVLRALTSISNQVTKLTTKTSEQDHWFEEKHTYVLDLHSHLKHLYSQLNTLFTQRKEAGHALKQFSTSLNHLATTEEHTMLSSALIELANLQEKIDQVNNDQSTQEYSTLTELIKEYVSLLDMVQLAFQERIKQHQQWLNAEETLRKKRETKTKLEQTPKGADKLPQAEMEIQEWEGRVVRGKEDFERISGTIKEEMDVFEQTRNEDFQKSIDQYLRSSLEESEKILQIWEAYLPEANKINV